MREGELVPGTLCYLKLATDLSSRFLNILPEQVDGEIRDALRLIASFFSVSYCAIFTSARKFGRSGISHIVDRRLFEFCGADVNVDMGKVVPGILSEALRDRQLPFPCSADDLSAVPGNGRARFASDGVESLLLVPVSSCSSAEFVFVLASVRKIPALSEEQALQIQLLAGILVSAMCSTNTEMELQRATRNLSEAQRICRIGNWEWDVDSGKILQMEAIDRILGAKPDSQSDFLKRVHAADLDRVQKTIDRALRNQGDKRTIEYQIYTRRGDIRIARSRFERSCSATGTRMTGTFHDVTGTRRRERELQELRSRYWHADRVAHTGLLVASLAHELKQPLTAILSNAQAGLRFLFDEPLDQHEISEILKDIVADNRRARQIIDALGGMMRRNETNRERINATDIARGMLSLLHSEFVAQQVGVQLTCNVDCFVLANKAQIEQVLLNLMLNCVESMRSQPADKRHIRLQVDRMGKGEMQVAVSDSGVGIPKEQLGSVFEAFWTTKAYGLGMGLAVCRSIIEAHGGRIWAESNIDRGAVFLFRLPLADPVP